jgi:hypothetical protein
LFTLSTAGARDQNRKCSSTGEPHEPNLIQGGLRDGRPSDDRGRSGEAAQKLTGLAHGVSAGL